VIHGKFIGTGTCAGAALNAGLNHLFDKFQLIVVGINFTQALALFILIHHYLPFFKQWFYAVKASLFRRFN
jgi:hypothetical protein